MLFLMARDAGDFNGFMSYVVDHDVASDFETDMQDREILEIKLPEMDEESVAFNNRGNSNSDGIRTESCRTEMEKLNLPPQLKQDFSNKRETTSTEAEIDHFSV